MGVPITKYTILKAITDRSDLGFIGNKPVSEELKRYKLFGIILHDPDYHREFHITLGKHFELLNYISGQDFLFFGLTDIPQNWIKRSSRHIDIVDLLNRSASNNTYKTPDESISAYTLATALKVAYDDLPVIMLTDNLQNNNFIAVRSSSHLLESQLRDIGFYCSREDNIRIEKVVEQNFAQYTEPEIKNSNQLDLFTDIVGSLNIKEKAEIIKLKRSISSILSDFLAILVNKNGSWKEKLVAEPHTQQLFESLRVFLQIRCARESTLTPDEFENHMLTLLGYMANAVDSVENQPGIEIDPDCEKESHILINTFNMVAPAYSRFLNANPDTLDYSPLFLSLAKTFEKEINLSVVHWVRKHLNIEMPLYYNKRKIDPNPEKYFVTPDISDPQPVNFNHGNDNWWVPPGIGQSLLVLKDWYQHNKFPDEITEPQKFIDNWSTIGKYRNKTAHQNILSHDNYQKAYNSFTSLITQGKIKQMNELKKKYKR